jgi:hypothetical protein
MRSISPSASLLVAGLLSLAGCSMYNKIFHPHGTPAPAPSTAGSARPAELYGTRDCLPPPSDPFYDADDYDGLAGCKCAFTAAFDPMAARSRECGAFPCTMDGCYVHRCESDGDCAYGECGIFAGQPRGYCATH